MHAYKTQKTNQITAKYHGTYPISLSLIKYNIFHCAISVPKTEYVTVYNLLKKQFIMHSRPKIWLIQLLLKLIHTHNIA
jgi:hypothetical protein